jgi:hypothetical protein
MELFVEIFTSSWAVERWNLSSVSLLLSLFLKLTGENMITMILWFLNFRHSGTLFGMWFLTSKGWSKRVKKTFSMILERVFEMV